MTEIVISHINDNDFEELVDVLESSNIFMYDKSGTYSNDKYKIIKQPDNTYDEGETYLTHIIENYDKLAEYTLFIQDGIKRCISSLSNFKNTTTDMINTNRRVYFYDKLIHTEDIPHRFTVMYGYSSLFDIYMEIKNNRYKKLSDIKETSDRYKKLSDIKETSKNKRMDKFAIKNACKELDIWMPKYYKANCIASFLVKKNAILERPKEFYIKLKKWIMKSEMNEMILHLLWPIILEDECQLTYDSSMLEDSQLVEII
jgi:hypothetical protein